MQHHIIVCVVLKKKNAHNISINHYKFSLRHSPKSISRVRNRWIIILVENQSLVFLFKIPPGVLQHTLGSVPIPSTIFRSNTPGMFSNRHFVAWKREKKARYCTPSRGPPHTQITLRGKKKWCRLATSLKKKLSLQRQVATCSWWQPIVK